MGRVGIMGYIWDIGQCRDKKTVLPKTVLPNDVPFQRTVFGRTVLRRLDITCVKDVITCVKSS